VVGTRQSVYGGCPSTAGVAHLLDPLAILLQHPDGALVGARFVDGAAQRQAGRDAGARDVFEPLMPLRTFSMGNRCMRRLPAHSPVAGAYWQRERERERVELRCGSWWHPKARRDRASAHPCVFARMLTRASPERGGGVEAFSHSGSHIRSGCPRCVVGRAIDGVINAEFRGYLLDNIR
jgi:hypothetical protein